ncbi:MATE family efflux transporter [Paenibacillus chibensis]|uniref:MATE family efflux transporter n=1 Tax=Paenibacillus chibensis TaxID=59846 RepID=UPI000FD9AA90|nr:MATE family efflux transporter [Paenibacillus chibensis]MEC0370117.1 MATE family efflux transporter [Paenibacillus chibensis]
MQSKLQSGLPGSRDFNRQLVRLVIPIAVQNLISASVIMVDVMMLGSVSQSAMSAVSLAGQITFMLTLFYMGLATGVGILTAQYWGKKDIEAIQRILRIASTYSLGISIVFFLISLCFPDVLMRIFTNDSELITYGSNFLRVISFSYMAMGLSQMYLSVMKSMEKVRISALISTCCLILNIAFNALCLFVFYPGMPDKAIAGVAVATVGSRFIELGCCIVYSLTRGDVQFHLPMRDEAESFLRKDFIKYTLPVQANYIIWGGALTATTAIMGHVNADLVASNAVAAVIKDLAIVLCSGISSGGAVLVGKYLGSSNKKMAVEAGNRISMYALLFGALAGIVILLLKPAVFHLVNLNDTAQSYLNGMLYICAYYCIGKSLNSAMIGGIFPAGGDSRFGFWCDLAVMWGVVLPLSYLSAFVWHAHPMVLFAVISLDEVIKIPIAFIRYRQYRWLNNITRDFN